EMSLLFELKDKQKFQATLDRLLLLIQVFKKIDYLGRPLYVSGLGGAPESGDDAKPGDGDDKSESLAPTLGLIDTHFAFGSSRNTVEEVIRRVGKEVKSINDSPDFKSVAASVPPPSIFLSYDSPATIEYMLYQIKEVISGINSGDEGDDDDAGKD